MLEEEEEEVEEEVVVLEESDAEDDDGDVGGAEGIWVKYPPMYTWCGA